MRYRFKGRDLNGKVIKGVIDAIDENFAIEAIQAKKLIPISVVNEDRVPTFIKEIQKLWEGASLRDMTIFFRQLAILIEAKVSIVPALQAIGDQTENEFLQTTISEIVDDIEDGMQLSESMSKHPVVFSQMMVNMIRAGEVSGNLQKSIEFLAENTEKNYQLNSKIRSALFYPAFVVTVAFIIGFIVMTVILPKITKIIKELGVTIPWYTQILMRMGDFMQSFWWAVLMVIFVVIGAAMYYFKTEDGRSEWDQIKIKMPIFGTLFRYIYITRFSDNLSMLLAGGIPIVRALTIVGDVVSNRNYQSIILKSVDEIKAGGNMSSVFMKHEEFPAIVTKMIKIGEETGKISGVLKNVSSFYEEEIDRYTRNLTALIEPVMIVLLGIGVAILVFAILMPIYNIAGSIQ